MKADTIIFDLGGVLIDWNPRHLYRKIFTDEEEMEWFLENVCNSEWNVQQDAGRTFEEAVEQLIPNHPNYRNQISAFHQRWSEMLGGPITETVQLLERLKTEKPCRLLALTNWSNQTFPIALERYQFLKYFEGILVSGDEKMKKPDHEIYHLLIDRYDIIPSRAVFIDDSLPNVEAAIEVGLQAIYYSNAKQLHKELDLLI